METKMSKGYNPFWEYRNVIKIVIVAGIILDVLKGEVKKE
jgi:hypothetical protein